MTTGTSTRRVVRGAPAKARATVAVTGKKSVMSSAYGEERVQEEQAGTIMFPPGVEPAFVRVNAGKTLNLGNYESLRIDVSISLPCLPEDINATYEQAADFAFSKLMDEEATWMGTKNVKPAAKRR